MKTIKKVLVLFISLVAMISFSITALAEESWRELLGTTVDGSVLTDKNESTGTARQKIERGYYLSDGSSYISDEGNNVVYISGSTYCHRTAEELRADVYLQRLVNGNWVTVTYQHYSKYNTYYAHNGFDILVKPGYFYRTVTNHVAINGDIVENLTSRTDGLYIG